MGTLGANKGALCGAFALLMQTPVCRPYGEADFRVLSIGVLNKDLKTACLEALKISREACRDFTLTRSWDNSAKQFLGNVSRIATDTFRRAA